MFKELVKVFRKGNLLEQAFDEAHFMLLESYKMFKEATQSLISFNHAR